MTAVESRSDIFESTRPLLFSIAYRMLGSVTDAEDVVQESFLRWLEAPETEVRAPRAYLATIVTRLAINQLQSAQSRRETYVGPWLPEPIMTEHAPDPSEPIELAESLSMAFLMMLERLSPTERAVLLLHDVFDFEYAEIGRIVDKSEVNCRQLLTRAKKHIGERRARFEVDREQADRLLNRFIEATRAGDIDGLVGVLAEDITLWADGGGKVPGAAVRPIQGADAVARFVVQRARTGASLGRRLQPTLINGQPGFVIYEGSEPRAALVLETRGGRIHGIYAIANPDKLHALTLPA
ncbi:MAG TPA: RNA polymerase sigma-70 factor [Gemmatimonadaceae bacterium]|nr:RNA polymerase sigma-70 factor [Gemmatimonadaceae bacterium]